MGTRYVQHPDISLALLHLGGTKVVGIILTMDAKQGVQAIEPLEDFMQAIAAAGLEQKVRYLNHGDTYNFEVAGSPQD